MSDLLLHLLSVPHRVNFLRLGRHGELCERNYRFYLTREFDLIDSNCELSDTFNHNMPLLR
jgi:hypothetical protein